MATSLREKIIEQCKKEKIKLSVDYIELITSLVAFGMISRTRIQDKEDDEYVRNLIVKLIKERYLNEFAPCFITLKSQLYFIKNYIELETIIQKHRCRMKNKTAQLIQEICNETVLNNSRDIEVLYQKMLVVITLVSGLGNPTVPCVLKEVAIALQSVLQPSELPRYVTLSKQKKEEQLTELVYIVTGIRLFNRDCDRGGEGIDDLPNILQVALERSHTSIIEFLELLMDKVYVFTAAVEVAVKTHKQYERSPFPKNLTLAIELLVVFRQQEIYIRKLLSDVEICEEEIRSSIFSLQKGLIEIHETVKFRTAVPTSQVYPKFINIATIWAKLQDQVIALSNVNDIILELRKLFPDGFSAEDKESIEELLHNVTVLTDAERLELTMGKSIVECDQCEVFHPSSLTNFDTINIQFLGFCTYSFVIGRGALIPGNPNIGIAEWGGKYFAFCCPEYAKEFGKDPAGYLGRAFDFIKSHVEYIYLFQLQDNVRSLMRRDSLILEDYTLRVRQNQEIQTETHVFDEWLDVDYSSSVWEHRRRALQLASIAQCATRSTQTQASHYRNGVSLQTLREKDKEVQTNTNVMTNTPKLRKFILRVRRNDCRVIECHDCSFNQFK